MKIGDLWRVNPLAIDRRQLMRDRELVTSGKCLGVTIQSKYQDDDLVEAVRSSVVAVLDARIAEAERELRDLGVDLTECGTGLP